MDRYDLCGYSTPLHALEATNFEDFQDLVYDATTMRRTIILFCLLLSFPFLIQAAPVVAFVDVNVIPMDKERILPHQTVIVRNGTIAEIGNAKRIKIPKDAQKIDGAGKYLIPGLTDMHVHLFTQKRAGVMLKGKYYTQDDMNKWLDEIAPRFQHALDDK